MSDDELEALLETPGGWSAERALEDAVKELAAEVLALRAERERLRLMIGHARDALVSIALMEHHDREGDECQEDHYYSDGYDDAIDKTETRAWAAVEWIDCTLLKEQEFSARAALIRAEIAALTPQPDAP
jgi:uncharacterized small protein (DUF1192 family)